MEWNSLALVLIVVIGIVLLFAQVKLFEIATTLKEILAELRSEGRPADGEESLSILRR